MFERVNYEKEKRRKRLAQRSRKKTAGNQKSEMSKWDIKRFLYDDQFSDNRELINARQSDSGRNR